MYDIYLNSDDSIHSFNSFRDKMIEICNQHRNENRALAFAFILYDFHNPHLRKVLEDNAYWLALNEISGKYLTVFSLNYTKERQKSRRPVRRRPRRNNEIEFLTLINTSQSPAESSNELIQKYFGTIEVKYPSILFFQVDNDTVTDTLLIQLDEETIEQGFLELKSYIQSAVETLEKIENENKFNIDIIFDNLESNVKSTKSMRKFKRVTKNAGGLIGLISSIKGLFG